jgi:hypothetical protein
MKSKDIDELYDKLTSQERAKLTFEALCIGDKETANKITDSVPRYDYQAIDFDFRNPLNNYFQVAHIWTAEYWKCYCKMLAVMGLQANAFSGKKDEIAIEYIAKIDQVDQLHHFWEQRLIALGLILKALEKSHAVNPATIIYFSDAQMVYGLEFEPDHLEGDASEYYEMYLAQFVAFIDGTQTAPEVDDYFSLV